MTEMKTELALVKSEHFGEIQADIYRKGEEMMMTIGQLAVCLGYADRKSVEKIIERNSYLKNSEFSTSDKMSVVEGVRTVMRETRLFTEDGIYEVTFLAKTEKAREFRAWVRKILKQLRTGDLMLTNGQATVAPVITQAKIEQMFNDKLNHLYSCLNRSFQRKVDVIEEQIKAYKPTLTSPELKPSDETLLALLNGKTEGTSWKKWVYTMIDAHLVVTGEEKTRGTVLHEIYDYMKQNYGFVVEQERKRYVGRKSTIDLIESNKSWRDVMSSILVDRLHNNISAQVTTEAATSTPKPVGEAPKKKTPVAPQEPPKSKEETLRELVQTLAKLKCDAHKWSVSTYRCIYEEMENSGVTWKNRISRYVNKHGRFDGRKRTLILASDSLFKIFCKVANELIEKERAKEC